METLRVALAIVAGLILPQALGVCGFYWAKGKSKILKAATLIIAPLSFFIGASLAWRLQAKAIADAGHYVCGAFGATAVFSTFFGSLIHLALAAIIFSAMHYIQKRR